MTRQTWTAVSLCFLIWFVYMRWFAPVPPTSSVTTPTENAQTTTQAQAPVPTVPTPTSWLGSPGSQSISSHVSTEKLQIGFSETGGRIAEVKSLEYKVNPGKNADPLPILSVEKNPQSFSMVFTDPALQGFSNGKYLGTQPGNGAIVFSREEAGAKITKEYRWDPKGYFVDVALTIKVPDSKRKDWGTLLMPLGASGLEHDANSPMKSWEAVYYLDQAVKREHAEQIADGEKIEKGNLGWLAFGNRYFTTAIANQSPINPDVALVKQSTFSGGYLRFPLFTKEGSTEIPLAFRFYIGPKEVNALSQVPGMKGLIDYGMFSAVAYPLLGLLKLLYSFVHNYGVAIILLTIIVRLLFYPLSVKSFRSMKNMQKLQPQIAVLKEKYKDDMKRLNEEQMNLFKAHKVNPASGCLPMLVQLPVFIALYAVLANSIELFQKPFFGWIQDLSVMDPFYVYPVLMGISMFLQQKMTPMVGMDPMQKKMMMLMPVIFSFMMFKLPSGLTLYIFVSTLLGIVQQWSMMDKKNGAETLTVAGAPQK